MAKLIFRFGSMNASKSAQLIMEAHNHKANGKTVVIFKPTLDTRNKGAVFSRAVPTVMPANLIKPNEVGEMFAEVAHRKPRAVLIDEVQFFSKEQIEELAQIVDTLNVTVIAFGLMTNFKSEMFEGSKRLVELADVVERVRSECVECSNEGIINARMHNGAIVTDGAEILTGGEDKYVVLCRKCYSEKI